MCLLKKILCISTIAEQKSTSIARNVVLLCEL